MYLPVVYMDIGLLATFLLTSLVIGGAVGSLIARRRASTSTDQQPSESAMFLRLMSRADHALENYVTSIQGHLSVLGEELPTDAQRWQVSRDAIGEAAAQMKRHVQRRTGRSRPVVRRNDRSL